MKIPRHQYRDTASAVSYHKIHPTVSPACRFIFLSRLVGKHAQCAIKRWLIFFIRGSWCKVRDVITRHHSDIYRGVRVDNPRAIVLNAAHPALLPNAHPRAPVLNIHPRAPVLNTYPRAPIRNAHSRARGLSANTKLQYEVPRLNFT